MGLLRVRAGVRARLPELNAGERSVWWLKGRRGVKVQVVISPYEINRQIASVMGVAAQIRIAKLLIGAAS